MPDARDAMTELGEQLEVEYEVLERIRIAVTEACTTG
jgi:anti-sigma regulatory factor (Ser/Thr protein kinase)